MTVIPWISNCEDVADHVNLLLTDRTTCLMAGLCSTEQTWPAIKVSKLEMVVKILPTEKMTTVRGQWLHKLIVAHWTSS